MVTECADIRFVRSVLRRYRPASTLIEDIVIRPVHGQNQGLGASETFSDLYMTRKVDPKRELLPRGAYFRHVNNTCTSFVRPEAETKA